MDLVITQDVFEHVLNPGSALAEICRTLKPDGAHLFTVPLYRGQKTVSRAIPTPEGIKYLLDPVYHSNPVDNAGSLVITDWGDDLPDFISASCGMMTEIFSLKDSRLGIDGEFLEVFLSRKAGGSTEVSL